MKRIKMRKWHRLKYFVGFFLALFFIAGQPAEFGRENNFFQGYLIPRPVIRVGLLVGVKQATIRASSGMKVYEINREYRLLAEDVEEVVIRVEKENLTEKFMLLIAQTNDQQEAELMAADLSQKLPGQVTVEEKVEAGSKVYQLKYGEFFTRSQALESIRTLEKLGCRDVWIIRDFVTLPDPGHIWLLIDHKMVSFNKESELYFIPSFPESFLSLNDRSYRGIFQLKNTGKGLDLINILNLEDYLKGVVPLEMSPQTFNALEALKAQAVAARTYALKNLGRHRNLGFDLTDTQSSQVYGGLSAELPLSNRAVEETAGEVIMYKNELINALYTSTCGGQTEDAEKVFSGLPVPYLQSVSCSYEKQPEWRVETNRSYLGVKIRQADVRAQVFPLLAFNIVEWNSPEDYFYLPASGREIFSWLKNVENFRKMDGGKPPVELPELSTVNFIELARALVDFFGWVDRTRLLLFREEIDFLLKGQPDNRELQEADRRALAYLLQSGIFPAYLREDNFFRPVTRAEAAFILKKSLGWLEDFYHQGTFLAKKGEALEVLENGKTRLIELSSEPYLLRTMVDGTYPAKRLTLLGGEKIRWLEKDGRAVLLEVIYPPDTNVLDRNSRYNRWNVRVSREELEKNIRRYYPQFGRLVDLKVLQRGKSGRVISLQIISDRDSVVVQGLKVRWVLNLKDTLFSIDREFDSSGQLSHFIFSGRGWGHGVGLCQVGAYGMAVAGATYREIITHYYRHIKIEKIY